MDPIKNHPLMTKVINNIIRFTTISWRILIFISFILICVLYITSWIYSIFPGFFIYIQNYYSIPEIVGATNYENQIIQTVLDNTDRNVVRYIKTITVMNSQKLSCQKYHDAVGCAPPVFYGDTLESANIQVISANKFSRTCQTFEHTLYHEIGHVVDAYEKGPSFYDDEEKGEQYAENYADTHSKDKCHTEEYKQLNFEMQEMNRSISELGNVCDEKKEILSRWDKYKTGISYGLYYQYLLDYNAYDYCIKEYNQKISRYNLLIKEEDKLLR